MHGGVDDLGMCPVFVSKEMAQLIKEKCTGSDDVSRSVVMIMDGALDAFKKDEEINGSDE